MTFDEFFQAATGHTPYDFQRRLACGERNGRSESEWLTDHRVCESRLIAIPTGLGKTAAAVLAWLWNRLRASGASEISNPESEISKQPPAWPRRLVYCLPMRTLVEQTRDNVAEWLSNLLARADELSLNESAKADLAWIGAHSPVVLMGGEELDPARRDWDLYPEKPGIVIGTQDMLLSRALNRGYGMSRYRWPMHFALLNNDCLWVMDETQLMGVGLETSAQLDAFRVALRTVNACATWWMSATLDATRLVTVNHAEPAAGWPTVTLADTDLQLPAVHARLHASKLLQPANVSLSGETKRAYAAQLARFVVDHHQTGSLTLVVLNRVDRAQEVYQQVQKLQPAASLALVHSRFRPGDRRAHEAVLHAEGSRIVIATQAVEAGLDVSARTLITELAPWPSLVQRFGRCNRHGEFKSGEARIFWVDLKSDDNKELAAPYTAEELARARAALENLSDAGPQSLQAVRVAEPAAIRPVLRRKDLVELFDTTPDLAGHDLDIARYIRDGEDTDVQVFWRDCGQNPNQPLQAEPAAAELCRVSLPRFRDFLDKLAKFESRAAGIKPQAFTWNPLVEEWQPARTARAGGTYLLHVKAGGYSPDLGWVGAAQLGQPVEPLPPSQTTPAAGYANDPDTFARVWVTLENHTRAVVDETSRLTQALAPELTPAFVAAARWHDLGKAHEAFQKLLRGNDPARAAQLWAKSANPGGRCERRYFRHELASALAWLQLAPPAAPERDLVAYLIAAHHGKVRLSIRSLPGEEPPPDRPDARIARGILDGDILPPEAFIAIGFGPPRQRLVLSLEPMELGRSPTGEPSWLARMLALRDRFGPFRLAWLETLLRAADARGSRLSHHTSAQQDSVGLSPAMALREEAAPAAALSPAEQALVAELVAEGLSIQDKFRPEPLYKQTGRGHYQSSTVEEIRRARQARPKEDKS
jgi:CRISPR-associated endonuclease/helicase Cas3